MAYITSHLSQHQAHNSFAQIVSNFLDIWLETNIIIALHQRKGWCQNCFVRSIEFQLFDDWTKLIFDLWSTRLILWPFWLGLKEDNYQQLLPKVGEICTKYRFEKKIQKTTNQENLNMSRGPFFGTLTNTVRRVGSKFNDRKVLGF